MSERGSREGLDLAASSAEPDLHARMRKNPLAYALSWEDVRLDPELAKHRAKLIREAARQLDRAKMARFGPHALFELAINMYVHWCLEFWSSAWNVFDFVIVVSAIATCFLCSSSA